MFKASWNRHCRVQWPLAKRGLKRRVGWSPQRRRREGKSAKKERGHTNKQVSLGTKRKKEGRKQKALIGNVGLGTKRRYTVTSQNFSSRRSRGSISRPAKKCPPLIYWLVHCAQPCFGRDGNKVRKGGGESFSGFALSGSFLWPSAQSKASL